VADAPKRVRYSNNQFLEEVDFQDEQKYHIDMRRLHNRRLHTPGIVYGLDVTPGPGNTLGVSEGLAIDSEGRDIFYVGGSIQMSADPTQNVTIEWHEDETRPRRVGNVDRATRYTETPIVRSSGAAVTGSQVILAVVKPPATAAGAIDYAPRSEAGAREGDVTLGPRPPATVGPVTLKWGDVSRADLLGNLRVVRTGGVGGELVVESKLSADTLGVSGAAAVSGTLTVTGGTTLAAVTSSGGLNVTGASVLAGVTATGLSVSGAAAVNGTLTVTGATTLAAVSTSNLNVSGAAAVATLNVTSLTASGATLLGGTLGVTGKATLAVASATSLTVTGATSLAAVTATGVTAGSVTAGSVTVTSTLSVTGNATLAALSATSLSVSGATSLASVTASSLSTSGVVTVGGTLGVTGAATFAAVTAGSVAVTALTVSGNTTFAALSAASLSVSGATSLASVTASGLSTSGAVTVGGTLGVTGLATFAGNVAVNSALTVSGNTTLAAVTTASLGVSTSLTVAGGTTLASLSASALSVSGAASLGSASLGATVSQLFAGSASSLGNAAFLGFNTAAITNGWSFAGDGTNNGGAVIFGGTLGTLSFSTISSSGGTTKQGVPGLIAGAVRLHIDQFGSIGVGTAAPAAKLHVSGGDIRWANSMLVVGAAGEGGSLELGGTDTIAGTGKPYIDFHFGPLPPQNFNVRIINDANRQLTIDADQLVVTGTLVASLAPVNLSVSGALAVGTMTIQAGGKLQVVGGAIVPSTGWPPAAAPGSTGIQFPTLSGQEAFIRCYSPGVGENRLVVGVGPGTTGMVVLRQGGSDRLAVVNGRVGIGATAPVSPQYPLDVDGDCHASNFFVSSDERLKENVQRLDSVLERLRELHGVSFQWNRSALEKAGKGYHKDEGEEPTTHIGFLAQEVEQRFPELVSTWRGDDGEAYRALSYSRMTTLLVEAVKELADRLDRYETAAGGTR
jgi:hypothetical protein